jgi:hypothetical protein
VSVSPNVARTLALAIRRRRELRALLWGLKPSMGSISLLTSGNFASPIGTGRRQIDEIWWSRGDVGFRSNA